MKESFDFLINALPWIAIGLFVACSCATVQAKKTGNEMSRFFRGMCWSPAACFLFLAIVELYSGDKSSGITWLVLGVFNAIINYVNMQEDRS